MKSVIFYLIISATLFLNCVTQKTVTETSEMTDKIPVMVLGTYHMNNPGADVYNVVADDVLTAKRQAEIAALTEALANFKPTKIAIETPLGGKYDSLTQVDFQQYLKGKYELTRGEDEQIGYRLAKKMGHDKVYCVDARGVGFDYGSMMDYAEKNHQLAALERGQKFGERYVKEEGENLKKHTIGKILKDMNEPKTIKESHSFYMDFCKIGKGKDYPGADLVADWYKRNIRIFSNINKITESKEDRILVIFGAGHAPILRELINYSEDYQLVEVGAYL